MKPTDCVPVHTLWQGTVYVHAARCGLRITNPILTYVYQQHGHIKVSSKPLYHVEFWWNEGRETGVASLHDLIAAGITSAAEAIAGGWTVSQPINDVLPAG